MPSVLYRESVLSLESRSDLQRVVSSNVVEGGAVVDDEKAEETSLLCLLGNNISVDMYFGFQDYRQLRTNDYVVWRRTVRLSCLEVLVAIMLR